MSRTRSARTNRAGQATVEFAFVAPLFFLALFTAVEAALWTIETSAAVSVADEGARFAASAQVQPQLGPAQKQTDLTLTVYQQVQTRLQAAMFGTRVLEQSPCPTLSSIPAATVYICVTIVQNPRANAQNNNPTFNAANIVCPPTNICPKLVDVEVVGHLASLMPSGLFFGSGVPVHVGAETHALTFAG